MAATPATARPFDAREAGEASVQRGTACGAAPALARLIFFGNPGKPIAPCLKTILAWARKHRVAAAMHRDAWQALAEEHNGAAPADIEIFEEADALAQTENAPPGTMLVTLGGDGTMIHAIRIFRPFNIPVMGINLGSLGFNASVEANHVELALDTCLAGRAQCSERMLIELRWVRDGKTIDSALAINDVVLAKKTKGKVIRLRLSQGGEVVSDYEADGLIVSTPTGSTAYNLSAGGPIVHPSMRAIIVSAICPHTLAGRAVVLPPDPPLHVESESRKDPEQATAWIDGREAWEAEPNDRIEIFGSDKTVHIVDNLETRYFTALRRKFNWSGDLASQNPPEPL